MDQSQVPVLEALAAYQRGRDLSFTPPGHKQGRGVDPRVLALLGRELFEADVISLNGLDDRRMSRGVLKRAQALMAEAVRADHTFFSTCGSSLSVKSAMLAVAGPGEKLLVARNAHKSVMSGLIVSGVRPVWVPPQWDGELHQSHPPSAEAVESALKAEPDAKGALVASPTDYGTCADLAAIADACHRHDRTFIVDEAWGAHFPFHPSLPAWGMDAGADLCVTSVHKMGGGLEQGSVFHLRGHRVDPTVLKAREDLLGTTSPSALIYAVLDGWRRQMAERGEALLGQVIELATAVRSAIGDIGGMRVLGDELLGEGRSDELDPLKIVIDVSGLGIEGYQATDWLRDNRHVHMGLSDHRRTTAQLNVGDDESTTGPLLDALRALASAAGSLPAPVPVELPEPGELELENVMPPREAFFGPAEQVPAERADGRVAAEMVTPYPPGIPAIAPGERITAKVVAYLRSGVAAGMYIPDAADPSIGSLRVVSNSS